MARKIFSIGFQLKALIVFTAGLFVMQNTQALPFISFDARTAALGGVSVTGGARNSPYYNPALAAATEEDVDWVMMSPGVSQGIADPDDLEGGLEQFLVEAKKFENDRSPENNAATINALNALEGNFYQKQEAITIMAAVPSVNFSGAVYLSYQTYQSAKTNIGVPDLSVNPADYASSLQHKAVNIIEQGVALANYLDDPNYIFTDLMIGMTFKVMLFETYGYTENIENASVELDESIRHKSGDLNVDIGLAKEWGVWKLGFVVKNLLKQDTFYGATDEKFTIGPQARIGFAYNSRITMVGIDLDLNENDEIVDSGNTQYAALGWEIAVFRAIRLRFGYKQNLVGNKLGTYSGGLGIRLGGVEFNAAALKDKEGSAVFGDLSFRF